MNFFKKIIGIYRTKEENIFLKKISKIIGFRPKNIKIYKEAFTHRSTNITDKNGNPISYERLEFLGDSIIGSIIASYLFQKIPNQNEGYLTKMKSKIVNRKNLNRIGKNFKFSAFIIKKNKQRRFNERIYGDTLEALIGAIYLDKGYVGCEKFIHKKLIEPYVDISKLEKEIISYKSFLIEWCQKYKKNYVAKKNTQKKKFYLAKLYIDEKEISKAQATTKKQAEEIASKRACSTLGCKTLIFC